MGKGNQWVKIAMGRRIRLLQSAGMRDEPWLDIALTYIPWKERTYLKPKIPKPGLIFYPENRLYQSYLHRHPEALQEPVFLGDWTPPMARRFTWRQLQLIQQGYSKDKAKQVLENELDEYNAAKAAATAQPGQPKVSVIAAIQREEERVLQEAVKKRRTALVSASTSTSKPKRSFTVAGVEVPL